MTEQQSDPPPAPVCRFTYTTGAITWVCTAAPHGEPTFTPDGRPVGHHFQNRASTS